MSSSQHSEPFSADHAASSRAGAEAGLWTAFAASGSIAEFCQAWLAIQCRALSGVHAGLLLLEENEGTFVPAAIWPDPARDMSYLGAAAQRCLVERRGLVEPVANGDADGSVFIGYPIEVDARLFGAVVLDVATRPDGERQAALRALHWGVGWLEALFRRRQAEEDARRLARAGAAMQAVAAAGEGGELPEAAMALANDLALRLNCERVSIGLERKQRIRLQAISNSAWFDRKTQLVSKLENAMEEALDQRKTVVHPPVEGLPKAIAVAHRDIAGAGAACSVMLPALGRNIGVITFERSAGPPFGRAEVELAQSTASLAGTILALKMETHRWFAGRLARYARRFFGDLTDPRRPSFRIAVLALVLVAGFLAFAEGEYRVPAKSVIEGEVQRALVAPFEGYVAEAPVRAGQTVVQGALLARLDDRDLQVERQGLASEREQHVRRYRDALAKRERPTARILASQIAEAEAKLALVDEKLARTFIRAPFDGVVVTGDLSKLLGTPVEQGKILFEVAPLDAYRVILKVDERDIREVAAGQSGSLVLSGLTGEALPFRVKNVSVATAEDGGNFFRVEAQLEQPDVKLRPGMEGVGKIVIGERKYVWIWTHRLADWLRLAFWKWLP